MLFFLGAIFIQIEWQHVINEKNKGGNVDVMKKLLPALFCLMVKLSSEPSVRQGTIFCQCELSELRS